MVRVRVLRRLIAACLILVAVCQSAPAQPLPIERRIAHPNGLSLLLHTIEPRVDSIVLSATIANPTDREMRLNRARGCVVEDQSRGIHFLNPPVGNPELRIPARSEVAATLVFTGPLAPTTRQLTVSTNQGVGTPDNPHDDAPAVNASVPVPPQTGATGEVQANHPNGVALRVQRALDGPAGCVVALRATNGSDRAIRLNGDGSMVLTDGRGVAARLNAPSDNPELAVPPGHLLAADLAFDCRNVDRARGLMLSTNRGTAGTADNPYDTLPAFALPLSLVRRANGSPSPSTSRVSLTPIARSQLSASRPMVAAAPASSAAPDTPIPEPRPEPPSAAPPALPAPPAAQPEAMTAPPPRPAGPAVNSQAEMKLPRRDTALRVAKSDRGWRVVLSADTLFGSADDTLQAAGQKLLVQLAALIAKTHSGEVVVAGHTDSAGSDDDNLALSERRAHAVAAWLKGRTSKSQMRFVEKAYGRTRPLAPNYQPDGSANPEGRERNRRIEITLRR